MAKLTTITVTRKYNLGNYESMEFGGEFILEENENVDNATLQAISTIERMRQLSLDPKLAQQAPQAAPKQVAKPAPKTAPQPSANAPQPTAAPRPSAAPQVQDTRTPIAFGSKALQQIVNRVSMNGQPITEADTQRPQFAGMTTYPIITMEFLNSKYIFDEQSLKALEISLKLSKNS